MNCSQSQFLPTLTGILLKMHINNEIVIDRRPWGRACGLLVSCAVMLIGIAREVGPAEIVLRAVTAAAISSVCVRVFVRILQKMADNGANSDSA